MKSTEGIGASTYSEVSIPWKFEGCSKQIMQTEWPTLGRRNEQEVLFNVAVSISALQWRYTADIRQKCRQMPKRTLLRRVVIQ